MRIPRVSAFNCIMLCAFTTRSKSPGVHEPTVKCPTLVRRLAGKFPTPGNDLKSKYPAVIRGYLSHVRETLQGDNVSSFDHGLTALPAEQRSNYIVIMDERLRWIKNVVLHSFNDVVQHWWSDNSSSQLLEQDKNNIYATTMFIIVDIIIRSCQQEVTALIDEQCWMSILLNTLVSGCNTTLFTSVNKLSAIMRTSKPRQAFIRIRKQKTMGGGASAETTKYNTR